MSFYVWRKVRMGANFPYLQMLFFGAYYTPVLAQVNA